tara:strand:- start:23852 stop:24610 length:759 start_codon:yes stop_codon:yes gene_type:complete
MEKYVIFSDLDGTLYIDGLPFDGVQESLQDLFDKGFKIFYTTNNTSSSNEEYRKKLIDLSFPVAEDSVITPIQIAKDFFIKSKFCNPYISSLPPVKEEFFSNTNFDKTQEEDPDSILIAFNKDIDYEELEKIAIWINRGIPYFLTHIDYCCPSHSGPLPDCGSFGELFLRTTGIRFTDHFGKPGKFYADYLISKIDSLESIVIGDRIYTDGLLGKEIGAKTVIVLSGETETPEDISKIDFFNTAVDFFKTLK